MLGVNVGLRKTRERSVLLTVKLIAIHQGHHARPELDSWKEVELGLMVLGQFFLLPL